MLDELHSLFKRREPIPGDDEFPGVYPKLPDYSFPHHVLSAETLETSLAPSRVTHLREVLMGDMHFSDDSVLSYAAPWDANDMVVPGSVDLLVPQAVMEHVDDLSAAYSAMRRWLKPRGIMSHRIDYSCHGITNHWYGDWTVSPTRWRMVRGRRTYLINRLPHSAHMAAMQDAGFEILSCTSTTTATPAPTGLVRIPHKVADLSIKGAFVVARPASS